MRRRDFIVGFGSSAAWPVVAHAQLKRVPVVGFLGNGSADAMRERTSAFLSGLAETGYADNGNVTIEYRWANDQVDRLARLAAELIERKVAVITALGSTPAALAARRATTTIPIVFLIGADPVEIGLVSSLARPGSNVTGFWNRQTDMLAKRLEMMHEAMPLARTFALLVNPNDPLFAEIEIRNAQTAASLRGVRLLTLAVASQSEIEAAFATVAQRKADALLVSADALFTNWRKQLVTLAARYAVPTMHNFQESVTEGGLISYGVNVMDTYRRAGAYTGRILRGEKPADLPIEQPTRFEMKVNLRTAKMIGIEFPTSILLRADEVVE